MSLSNPREENEAPAQLTELRTPLEIVNRQRWLLHYLAKSTGVIRELREKFVDAKDAFNKLSYAHQLSLEGKGSADDRAHSAQVKYWDEFMAMRVAEKALEFAVGKRKDLEVELGITQSESKLVIAEMSLAGRVNL